MIKFMCAEGLRLNILCVKSCMNTNSIFESWNRWWIEIKARQLTSPFSWYDYVIKNIMFLNLKLRLLAWATWSMLNIFFASTMHVHYVSSSWAVKTTNLTFVLIAHDFLGAQKTRITTSVQHLKPANTVPIRSRLEADSVDCLTSRSWPVEHLDPAKAQPVVVLPSKTADWNSDVDQQVHSSDNVATCTKDSQTQTSRRFA
jgi:hypothetical protein